MRHRRYGPSSSRRRQSSPSPFAVFCRLIVACVALAAGPGPPALAGGVEYATPISTRLNPTGRTVAFPVPLKDGGQTLGDVVIQLTADDAVLVDKASFTALVSPVVSSALRQAIEAVPDQAGFAPISSLAAPGFSVRFDSGLQELALSLTAEQRPTSDLNFGGGLQRPSSDLAQPSFFSGYLNIFAGLNYLWGEDNAFDDAAGSRLELDSAVRVGDVVIENRAAYDGDVDSSICPIEASCIYGHAAGLKRQSSRLIYDMPGQRIRAIVGDTDGLSVPLQRSTELLGFSLEQSNAKFRPGQNISATGSGSFRIARLSTVDVLVNGYVVQTLRLRPGNYNVRDLPLATGANILELAITDDTGERQTLSFSAYSDPEILPAGESEWAVAAGAPSYLLDDQRTYSRDTYMGTGFLRYGITDVVTGEANLQADSNVVMGGLGFALATDWGIFGLHGAASTGAPGSGAAVDLRWRLSNFEGLAEGRGESLQVDAEYRSVDFHTPGEFLTTASGILYPEFNYWLRLGASYSFPIYDQTTGSISARYQFGDDDRDVISPFTFTGDRYGADFTVSRPLGPTANASLLVGYSNELYVRDVIDDREPDAEFRVALRLNVRPTEGTSIAAGYDTLGNQSTVSAYQAEGSGIGRWDAAVDAQSRGYDDAASVNASVGYYGNRAELRLSHYADADGVDFSDLSRQSTRQRTSLRVGTAIAFAGDKVAVGAPVRGGAFAIVTPHDTLADKEITVGAADNVRAKADAWGNALVPDLSAYLPGSMTVDVDDLPLGYSLGRGAFDTFAPYKAGYSIEVGSAYSVSAYGTLIGADGAPVSLLTGVARKEGGAANPVTIFTNGEGRFGAEGLAPGRWIVEMLTEGATTRYVIDVPDGTNGLIKVGTLHPEGSHQ